MIQRIEKLQLVKKAKSYIFINNLNFKGGLQKLIFAWGESDPTSPTSNDWKAHNLSNAFSESLNLLNYRAVGVKNNATANTTLVEMALPNVCK